ncbi:MAG: hypothetical protein V2I43_14790 [Parvularcula sp.]|nr:hypothetical protein [Parvularcula sp.]
MVNGHAAGAAFLVMISASAAAQTDDILFNGTVGEECTVVADTDGTLSLNGLATVLSSTEAGGGAGAATVTTNSSSFSVSIDTISAFTSGPADADTNTVFATTYGATGATTASGVSGDTATSLGLGSTSLSVDASATKSSGTFSAGSYVLTATVRCTA